MRQLYLDAEPAAARVAEPQLAAVQRDLLGDDREPEAGAVGARVLATRERLEQAGALVGRDARPIVLDADHQPAVGALEADRDAPVLAPVQRRVVEQVVDQQPQTALPAVDRALVDAAGELVLDAGVALAGRVDGAVE